MGRQSKQSDSARPLATTDEHRSTRRPWMVVALMIAVSGIAASAVASASIAHGDSNDARRAFEAVSEGIAARLQLGLQHQDDLVVNAAAFVVTNAAATQAQFRSWATTAHVLDRYPEVLGFGVLVIVPAADLASFVTQLTADPPGTSDSPFQLLPPGDRPFYCLLKWGVGRPAQSATPLGTDWCAGDTSSATALARDTGLGTYLPVAVGTSHLLSVNIPVYRDGVIPTTVAARRAAFLGWVGTVSDPRVLLDQALHGLPGVAVSLDYNLNSSAVSFSVGAAGAGARTITTDLRNGWSVRTSAEINEGGILSHGVAIRWLLTGMTLSGLLAALVLSLGSSRSRALLLVDERTSELRHQALHDSLTGLPNRALIMDRIDQLLARNRRNATSCAALYMDLDDFKNVNDTLGHEAGDRLLAAVAARLTSTLRDADTVGRMGGDEFVILIDGARLNIAPELVAERLLDVMRQPFDLDGTSMPLIVGTSIGIAIGDRATGDELLRDADVAMYQAKEAGKNRYEVFFPEMHSAISRRVELEFDLRSAMEGQQFRLAYQPIYNLDDLTLVGVEALLRWVHPVLGVIQPDEFIPILERTGMIQEVGRWVLREACRQTAIWHGRGDTLDISVNVSGRQLDHDAIVEHIREALESSGLEATSLIIEVTETALMRNAAATAGRLQTIKDLGVRIAVDDFGTGYSSLAYLRQFPVDCLKIDRAFTSAITTSPESKALIGTLVQLGKDLGLRTLAEGVETAGELDHLRREHVNEAQGFLLSKPLDPQTLESRFLQPTRSIGAGLDRHEA